MGLLVEEGEKRLVIAWWPSPGLLSLFADDVEEQSSLHAARLPFAKQWQKWLLA